jgi:hypothetical protein
MKRLLAIFALASMILFGAVGPALAVEVFKDPCQTTPQAAACVGSHKHETPSDNSFLGPHGILTAAVNILAIIAGIAAVIMIIVGGLRFVISSGDPNNVTNAKNAILAALIGVVIVVLSRTLVIFVLNRL